MTKLYTGKNKKFQIWRLIRHPSLTFNCSGGTPIIRDFTVLIMRVTNGSCTCRELLLIEVRRAVDLQVLRAVTAQVHDVIIAVFCLYYWWLLKFN